MKKQVKWSVGVLGICLMLALAFFGAENKSVANAAETAAYAQGARQATQSTYDFESADVQRQCAEMTDSDLLQGETVTLDEYIANVKNGYFNTKEKWAENARLLGKIIPLKTLQYIGRYSYVGKEYLFYVYASLEACRITIVDYDCDWNAQTSIATFRAQVLNVNCYLWEENNEWQAITRIEPTAAFINMPQMSGMLQNEHAFNDYDIGYSKREDEGAVFRQLRFNYAGAYQITDTDLLAASKFMGREVFGYLMGKIPGYSEWETVLGMIGSLGKIVREENREVYADNENNIFDIDAKDIQVASPQWEKLCKVFQFIPQEENLLLNDYIETKVMVSQESAATRLSFGASFTLTNAYGNLLIEQPIHIGFNMLLHERMYPVQSQETPYYMLSGGTQVFDFTAECAGEYRFTASNGAQIEIYEQYSLAEQKGTGAVSCTEGTAYLQQKGYSIVLRNTGNENSSGILRFALHAPPLPQGNTAIESTYGLYLLANDKNIFYRLESDRADTVITVFDVFKKNVRQNAGTLRIEKTSEEKELYVMVQASAAGSMLTCTAERYITFVSANPTASITVINENWRELPVPTQNKGYAFKGWYLQEDYAGQAVSAQDLQEMNLATYTLYAKETPIQYTVRYETNGGSAIADGKYTVCDPYVLATNVEKEGYIFAGWYDNPQFTGARIERWNAGEVGDKTVYARWAQERYTVRLQAQTDYVGGKEVTCARETEVRYGESFALPVPVCEGFRFEGWFYNGRMLTDDSGVSAEKYLFAEDITVQAKWSRAIVTLYLNDNKVWEFADWAETYELYSPNDLIKQLLRHQNEEIRNKTFAALYKEGWIYDCVTLDESGFIVASGQSDEYVDENGNLTLYAQYKQEKYTIDFYVQGEILSFIYYYGDAIEYPPKPQGYDGEFVYETSKEPFTHTYMPDLTENEEGNGSVNVRLLLKAIDYTITYRMPQYTVTGETVLAENYTCDLSRSVYTVEDTVYMPQLTSNYYTARWYADAAYTNEITEIAKGSWGNRTVYAQFAIRYFTVSFNANGGSYCAPIQARYGQTIVLPTSTRAEHIGNWGDWGYLTDNVLISNFGYTYVVNGNFEFTAQWKRTSDITFANLQFMNQTARVYSVSLGVYMPNYYERDKGLNLSDIQPILYTSSSPYDPCFRFLGWFADKNLTVSKSSVKPGEGNVTVYAKWRYDYSFASYYGEETITDAGVLKNPYKSIYIGLSDTAKAQALIDMGLKYFVVDLWINMWELDDGYQHFYLYSDLNSGELWHQEHEHDSSKKNSTPDVAHYTAVVPIDKIIGKDYIYLRFDASGKRDDDWQFNKCQLEIQYVQKRDDVGNPEFMWHYKNTLDKQ
ncbi:MAG: InlB B-repeat-containing protein [Clostridiales bacterium]|nr:InlB B-repeat-containing protein [Clostridiales bacterium]